MESGENKTRLIGEINNRLQTLITIGIIFPALIYSFFKTTGQSEAFANNVSFPWWILITFYLVIYFLFELVKSRLNDKFLRRLNWAMLIEIGTFIVPFILYSNKSNEAINILAVVVFLFALAILVILPLGIIIVLTVELFRQHMVKFKNLFKKHGWG